MFKILDGRSTFYQWDLDRKLVIEDNSITEVHFCNRTEDCALICEPYSEGELWVVDVPNILLQENWKINVYGVDSNYTKHCETFKIIPRSKPDDYVYTETEVKNWEEYGERIRALEESGLDLVMNLIRVDSKVIGLEALQPAANAIKKTVEGQSVTIRDASPLITPLEVNVVSKNVIPLPYYYEAGKNIKANGVTFTFNDDGTILLNGTCTSVKTLDLYLTSNNSNYKPCNLPAGTYTLSGFYGEDYSKCYVGVTAKCEDGTTVSFSTHYSDKKCTRTAKSPIVSMRCYIYVSKGATFENELISPQLELGNTVSGYQPFYADISKYYISCREYGAAASASKYYQVGEDKKVIINSYSQPVIASDIYTNSYYNQLALNRSVEYNSEGYLMFKTDRTIPISFFEGLPYTTINGNSGVYALISRMYYNMEDYCALIALNLSDATGGYINGYALAFYSSNGLEIIYSTVIFDLSGGIPGAKATKVGWQKEQASYASAYHNVTTDFLPLNGRYICIGGYTSQYDIRMSVTYNRDTNKVIEELTQAIISLGGNV